MTQDRFCFLQICYLMVQTVRGRNRNEDAYILFFIEQINSKYLNLLKIPTAKWC